MDCKGKTAIVTGAASGIGAATAIELAKRGIGAVGLVDIGNCNATESALKNFGVRTHIYKGDVTSEGFCKVVFDHLEQATGDVVRVLVPAAGITRDKRAVKLDKVTQEPLTYPRADFQKVLEVNLIAPSYWAMEMAARILKSRAGKKWHPSEGTLASCIFIGSISARGNEGQISYASTKAALSAVAATLRTELKGFGVQVGVVHPGFTDTPMVQQMPPKVIEMVVARTQIGRLIKPEEIARVVANVISDDVVTRDVQADGGYYEPA